MFLLNLLNRSNEQNDKILNQCKHVVKHNERTNVSHVIMKRGDHTLEVNNIQYDIEEVDTCLNGNIVALYQDKKHRLYFDENKQTVHVALPIKHQRDTNVSTFTFQTKQDRGENMTKVTETVVGTSFREYKHFTEYFALSEEIENGVSAIEIPALLIPEPENPYDPNAVMVVGKLKNGQPHHIGYLKNAEKGGKLQPLIKEPKPATVRLLAYSDNGDFNDSYIVTIDV